MKRTERHHLKDNELARAAEGARQIFDERRNQLFMFAGAVVIVLAAAAGYYAWSGRTENRARTLLAEAMALDDARVGAAAAPGTPAQGGLSFETTRAKNQAALTKYKVAADAYPATQEGIFARYRQAATYMALGEAASAERTYQDVVDHAGKDSVIGEMARLGLAEAQTQTGQFDQAIATFKDLSDHKDGRLPADGVLLRLGRAYIDAGKPSDAQQTFNRLVQEFPDSPFVTDARRELDQLKKS